jgi:hypothetical protein
VTGEQAYKSILDERKALAAQQVKQQADDKAREQQRKRESARELIDPAIMKLAEVRDLLKAIECGDSGLLDDSALAMFARAALSEAGTELEQALFDLGLLRKGKGDYRPGGWFVGEIEGGADAEVHKTSLAAA